MNNLASTINSTVHTIIQTNICTNVQHSKAKNNNKIKIVQ